MRLDGAIATQRFIAADEQPSRDGQRVDPLHWAHTIYEWESAAQSVEGHQRRATTPAMEISRDGDFRHLRDYFYRPAFLSHGWSHEAGFRRGNDVLTAMIAKPAAGAAEFVRWFSDLHAPATLRLPGFATAGLFTLHEAQSLPHPSPFAMTAIYSLTDRAAALHAWNHRHESQSPTDLRVEAPDMETTCWRMRTPRLLATEVADAPPEAAAEERRARAAHRDRFMTQEELLRLLEQG
jgi:hypothetical protein